ncbi:MAG: ADP-ribose pyrophosphatase [Planctomycetota bacterium]|jgi:ADP-ribose pyrophosphatase
MSNTRELTGRERDTDIPADPQPFEPYRVVKSEQVYDSPWCGVRRDVLRLDCGRDQEHHVFQISPAVAVVPVRKDGSILLLWQYRHPLERTQWEVPAGRIDGDEEPAAAATRELLEETGHRAARIERVAGFFPSSGISSHYAHIFIAYDCEEVSEQNLDPAERMQVHSFPAEEVKRRLLAGEIEDGFTAIALGYHFMR